MSSLGEVNLAKIEAVDSPPQFDRLDLVTVYGCPEGTC
jgi:hypothetical protein